MNVIPLMKFPAPEEVLPYMDSEKFPCAEEARRLLLEETALGNVIQSVGDAGCMPDETVVVIDFAQDAKKEYPQSVIEPWSGNKAYRFVRLLDKFSGVVYVRFFFEKQGDAEHD